MPKLPTFQIPLRLPLAQDFIGRAQLNAWTHADKTRIGGAGDTLNFGEERINGNGVPVGSPAAADAVRTTPGVVPAAVDVGPGDRMQ